MDDRNWMGETELTSASQRRKRLVESGGTGLETTSYLNSAAANDDDDNNDKMEIGTSFINNASVITEESHTRSLLKGVTWRILATMTTVIIAWFVTGEVAQAFRIGFVEFFAKLAIYYMHERAWARIRI